MRQVIVLSAALLASVAFASKTTSKTTAKTACVGGPKLHRASYDYEATADREEACLCNEVDIVGSKSVLVNLDDKCSTRHFEREGVFLQTGDSLIVMGSYDAAAT